MVDSLEHTRPWNPLSVDEVCRVFRPAQFPWWIAGGVALELHVGAKIRAHGDIDVLVMGGDQATLRDLLAGWQCWAADPPGELRPWAIDETLPQSVHDVWCRASADDAWRFQVMLEAGDDEWWISRRNDQVRLPLAAATRQTSTGVPYLAPHAILFYKAKRLRPKDLLDLQAVRGHLAVTDRDWLRGAITLAYGEAHPWLPLLA